MVSTHLMPYRSTSTPELNTKEFFYSLLLLRLQFYVAHSPVPSWYHPLPLLSCLHSSWQVNSWKRPTVWCNFLFLNTAFSGALLRKSNLLRNRSNTINGMKHKCSLWLPGGSLHWVYNKIRNLESCHREKEVLPCVNNFIKRKQLCT